jgi:Domain of unknown function (DUF5666)
MKTSNNKLLIIIGVLVMILLVLGAATVVTVIQRANANTTATITPTIGASTSPTSTTKAKSRHITGVIQSINAQSIVIDPSKGTKKKPITVMLTPTTSYKTSSGAASLSDLKVGKTVQVNATLDAQTGELDATRVTIQPASATPTSTP